MYSTQHTDDAVEKMLKFCVSISQVDFFSKYKMRYVDEIHCNEMDRFRSGILIYNVQISHLAKVR